MSGGQTAGGGDASVNPHERKLGKQEHPTNQRRHRTLVLKYCNCNKCLITWTALSAGLRESNGQQQWSAKVSQVHWGEMLVFIWVRLRADQKTVWSGTSWSVFSIPLSLDVQPLGGAGLKMVRLLGTLNQQVLKIEQWSPKGSQMPQSGYILTHHIGSK